MLRQRCVRDDGTTSIWLPARLLMLSEMEVGSRKCLRVLTALVAATQEVWLQQMWKRAAYSLEALLVLSSSQQCH